MPDHHSKKTRYIWHSHVDLGAPILPSTAGSASVCAAIASYASATAQ